MLRLDSSARFKRDLRLCSKRGLDLDLLDEVVATLRIPQELPVKNRDHNLVGDYAGCRECHVSPDWLLVYKVIGDTLYLDRTGTHADLFG